MDEHKIPADLRHRYESLAIYKPMEIARTTIYVRDWMVLIERIASLTSENERLSEQLRRMTEPVSDEEWTVMELANVKTLTGRSGVNTFIAQRNQHGHSV